MPSCFACEHMRPTRWAFICQCKRLLDKARLEKNPIRKLALYWAGGIVFIDQEKDCKSVTTVDGSG